MFVYVGITSENDESHVVMQAWRFHLDVENEMASFHWFVKMEKMEKQPWVVMGRITNFETVVTSYHQHFSKYLEDKKQVMNFILNLVWKMVFANYKATFPIELFMKILWNINFGTHWKSWKSGHPMRKGIWEGGVAKWKELGIIENKWTCHSKYFQKVTKCDWWRLGDVYVRH